MRFFTGVIGRLDQKIGNLFYHGVSPAEIKSMGWRELTYWDGWVDIINKEKLKALDK